MLADPVLPGPGSPPADYGLGNLLAAYGLRLNDDIVIDPANAVPQVGAETLIANRYGSHPIVRSLSDRESPGCLPARAFGREDREAARRGVRTRCSSRRPRRDGARPSLDKLDEVKKDAADHAGPVAIGDGRLSLGREEARRAPGPLRQLPVRGQRRARKRRQRQPLPELRELARRPGASRRHRPEDPRAGVPADDAARR